jgi:hypothetical protein
MNRKIIIFLIALFLIGANFSSASTDSETREIYFPTEHDVSFYDNFGDPRYGHTHEGVDIMGEQMMELYAAVDGEVSYLVDPEASWGYAVTIKDSDGYTYHYIHMNNDTPGTDDGKGGIEHAYASGIKRGAKVTRGQLVGWMGDSGNAENVAHHLHFEIRKPDDIPINPYASLQNALVPGSYSIASAMEAAPNININKNIATTTEIAVCESGALIKLSESDTLYYCGADSKRYYFPNDKIFFTWYDDFDEVEIISASTMAEIPLGGNVTYRPGSKMIKIQTDPKVYAVEKGGTLRHVISEEIAEELYGQNWKEQIDDIPDSFFVNYRIGEVVSSVR